MQIGCGYRVMAVKGREYLYVWHYETRDGRRRQVYEYIGPATDRAAGRRVVEALERFTRQGIEEARRRLQASSVGAMAAARRTSQVYP